MDHELTPRARRGAWLVTLVTLATTALVVAAVGHHLPVGLPVLVPVTALPVAACGVALLRHDRTRTRDHTVGHARRLALAAQALRNDNARLAVSNSELEAFAGRLAHDLRSPLGSVVTTLQTLTRPDVALDPAIRTDLLERALVTSRRSVELVEALLEHASAQGRGADAGLVDVTALAREVVDTLTADRVHGVRIELPEGATPAWADPRLLVLVLQNLLDNALVHGAPAVSRVRVRVDPEDDHVAIAVEDDGVAIPADRAEDVFRVGSGDPNSGGLGLGLATCRSVVERHGGRIRVAPSVLGGTAIRFTLPWPDDTATAHARRGQGTRATSSSSGSSRRTSVAP